MTGGAVAKLIGSDVRWDGSAVATRKEKEDKEKGACVKRYNYMTARLERDPKAAF